MNRKNRNEVKMFNQRELEVIEKSFKSGKFLNDNINYNSIIEMKRDLIELLEVIDISDVFRELYERKNYQVECWDYSYEYSASRVLYKNLNKGSAKAIRNRRNNNIIKLMIEHHCQIDIDYVVSWWSDGEYHYFQ